MKRNIWLLVSFFVVWVGILVGDGWGGVFLGLGISSLLLFWMFTSRDRIHEYKERISEKKRKVISYVGVFFFFVFIEASGLFVLGDPQYYFDWASDYLIGALALPLFTLGLLSCVVWMMFHFPDTEEIIAAVESVVRIKSVEVVPGENMVRVWLDRSMLDLNDELKEKVEKEARKYADKNLVGDSLTKEYSLSFAYSAYPEGE